MSGKLIMNALVMYDHQTGTLWSQFLSQGVKGELAGRRLETVPLVQTTFGRWVQEHPETAVLDKGRTGSADRYGGYYTNGDAGVIGEEHGDDRLDRKDKVLGVGFDAGPVAYPLEALSAKPVINDRVAGAEVVVFFQPETETALAYSRELDGDVLEFEQAVIDGTVLLRDLGTGSLFLPFTGLGIEGEHSGRQLERIHSVVSFWFAWSDFYPETRLHEES